MRHTNKQSNSTLFTFSVLNREHRWILKDIKIYFVFWQGLYNISMCALLLFKFQNPRLSFWGFSSGKRVQTLKPFIILQLSEWLWSMSTLIRLDQKLRNKMFSTDGHNFQYSLGLFLDTALSWQYETLTSTEENESNGAIKDAISNILYSMLMPFHRK